MINSSSKDFLTTGRTSGISKNQSPIRTAEAAPRQVFSTFSNSR